MRYLPQVQQRVIWPHFCATLADFIHNANVLLSPIEHSCILNATEFWSEKYDLEIKYLRVDKQGYIDVENLKELEKPTLFCSIGYVNNEIGTIQSRAYI